MLYNDLVRDCFFYPRHVGCLDLSIPCTVLASAQCSSSRVRIVLSMRCNVQQEVESMQFKTNGNPYQIALLELLCRSSIGKKINQLNTDLKSFVDQLSAPFQVLPGLYTVQNTYLELIQLMNKQWEAV
ncbi:MAG: hypothetical protein CK426_05160 [Legionella sp.]|nr:MAG: hypothetical protein CK423_01650 [Legionella sp.]PJD98747.1 MAG: hypothetical protein CK426_05160 [Legionella sp.]